MSMTISETLLPEFDHEMANLRRTLERVPEDRPDFTPHPKSMTMAQLAAHVANLPLWASLGITQDEFDMAPSGVPRPQAEAMTTRSALLASFDARVSDARTHLMAADDASMMKMWTLKSGGHTVLTMPKVSVLRSFVMNHMIHHRAQLTVYLRMNEVPVPSLYGPSADDM
jgi:uncharacterized damage-inducible protein DinB